MSTTTNSFVLRLAIGALSLWSAPTLIAAEPGESVVLVTASIRLPNPVRPWTKQNPIDNSGTGVVIDGTKIITNAHIVSYASEVSIQGHNGGDKFEAKVVGFVPQMDLAVLEPEDPAFFEKHPALPRSKGLPKSGAAVSVLGFPVGGRGLSMTRGVVSRVEYADYGQDATGFRIQVDAAVNPGNSGGPSLVENQMIGLTFGRLGEAENIGYIIPNIEIDAVLADLADGKYEGRPLLRDVYQKVENEALRARLKLDRTVRGVMVKKAGSNDPAYPVKEDDVLIKIGDYAIDNEGLILGKEGMRLSFISAVPELIKDGKVPITIIREGKTHEISLPVGHPEPLLIPDYHGEYPTYFVHGPLVFSPAIRQATSAYFRMNPLLNTQSSSMLTRLNDETRFPGEQLVVVTTPLLPHKIAKGYADPFGQIVQTVNGVSVKNMAHLVELLRDSHKEYLIITFEGHFAEKLVFRKSAIEKATEEILSENGISRRGSADMMAVWEKKPEPLVK